MNSSFDFGITGQDGSYLAEFLLNKKLLCMLKEGHHYSILKNRPFI